MREASRILFLTGALPYLLLGLAHAAHTPRATHERKGLSPRDPALAQAMAAGALLLTRHTDVWRAWVGFNLSHSLGAVLFGVAVLLAGRDARTFAHEAPLWLPMAIGVGVLYLLIGVRFWFRTPIAGIALSLASFVGAAALWASGR